MTISYENFLHSISAEGSDRLNGLLIDWDTLSEVEKSSALKILKTLSLEGDERAPEALENSPSPEYAARILIDSLKSENSEKFSAFYEIAASKALIFLTGDCEYAQNLKKHLTDNDDRFVKYAAIAALRLLASKQDFSQLCYEQLKIESDATARTALAAVIFKSKTKTDPDFNKKEDKVLISKINSGQQPLIIG